MRQYRLIVDNPASGARNMAVDEAIMMAVAAGDSLPTLRLYGWEPACLSLGYGQRAREADRHRLEERGWHLVRRATGGRAILHTDELTYSLSLPDGHPLADGDIVESYRRISRALLAALNDIGVMSQADKRADGQPKQKGPVCFEVPSHYEVTAQDGRKLVGSAQLRRKGGVLQHGSLPLYGDLGRIVDVLVFEDEAEREAARHKVYERAVTLYDALGGVYVPWEDAAEAVIRGFETTFDTEFIEGALSMDEAREAERLEYEVYGTDEWNRRR